MRRNKLSGMDAELNTLMAALMDIWDVVRLQFENLLLPSRLWQLANLAVVIVVTLALARWAQPRLRGWIKRRDWPMWRLRALLVVHKRLKLIFFVALMWLSTWVVQSMTPFPSRSFILELVASLATAWLVVTLGTRLVRNPALRTVVRWLLWSYVTLWVLGLTHEVAAALDEVAMTLGDTRLSLLTLLKAVILVTVFFVIARFVAATGGERIRRSEDISPSLKVLLGNALQAILYGVALFAGLRAVGVDLTGLAVLSGAIGVGLGFGLQKVVSNLVSGVIILLDKSIKPGDVISLGETFGWVSTLGARYASVTTRDGKEYLIPNEDLITGQVVNWSHSNEFVRLDVFFGTAYGDDPHKVRKIAIEAASSVNRVLTTRPPVCHITGFGDSSVDYILRFWITDPTGGLTNIRGNVYLALWDAFQEHGISIPFPQREVRVLNDAIAVRDAPGAE